MARYLVVAHQTASSAELLQTIERLVSEQSPAAFVLLVPATPVEDLLDWQDGEPTEVATRTAAAAKARWEELGAVVIRAAVADPSPLKAIEDELARDRESYDGIIIATLPLQRSRWLSLDQPHRIERRFGLPVTHVVGHSVTMTREDLIAGLNEDLNLELETVLRGVLHAASGRGMLGHELRELLKAELPSELDHALFLADKIVALGGEVQIRPVLPAPLEAARQLLPENIAAEKRAVAHYSRRIEQAADYGDKGLVIRLEELLAAETDHLEALERLAR
jgi:bacterioferritin